MPAKMNFKKSMLAQSLHPMSNMHDINKRLGVSIFFAVLATHTMAQEPETTAEPLNNMATSEIMLDAGHSSTVSSPSETQPDSLILLQQQEQAPEQIAEFQPIEFDDLDDLPVATIDPNLAEEIFRVAEQAKTEAQNYRAGLTTLPEVVVAEATQQELAEINQAPINIDQLMQNIQADSQIIVEANDGGRSLAELGLSAAETRPENDQPPGLLKRLWYKVRPPRELNTANVPRISAEVQGAPAELAANIRGKLSTVTQEAFEDFNLVVPQLRSISNQAAQAVGYYNASFKFERISANRVRVLVTPNEPVRIEQQNVEFTGPGQNHPQFQVIRVLPDQDVGDIFHHGLYEQTKTRINDAASDNGFFDAYWRLHDVKVAQPQNTAEINLRYETGERYAVGPAEFRMSDPSKPLPLDMDILQQMVPWKDGDDYTFWRVNSLANNLTNSRYFNYTLVDAIRPDPVERNLELPPDIQALIEQNKLAENDLRVQDQKRIASSQEVTQNVVDEEQFAGNEETLQNQTLQQLQAQQQEKQSETERLKVQARAEQKIPVIVTLNADKLNSLETGAGYGSDTGPRVRAQYRRAIVNKRGHAFDANMEVSSIRQSIDGSYSIPYHHPLNDYLSLVGGYEREERDDIASGYGLMIESAVVGADRIIKNPLGSWQHTYGVRYRLDRLTQQGVVVDTKQIPDAFMAPGSDTQQQSLLLGYQISRTDSDKPVNPSKGFKQTYKLELGSESLLSDADMAIVNAGWRFIYSLGENDDHQFVGRADLGYIYAQDFQKVPYNLRYFTGGDQSIRGFDYKSLTPTEYGYKVGGQALAVGSLEYNYQFKEGWRAALFTDFGNAYDQNFNTPTAYSVGLGVRWASPIGPIRLDVASGISDEGHPIRLHFFIGSQL